MASWNVCGVYRISKPTILGLEWKLNNWYSTTPTESRTNKRMCELWKCWKNAKATFLAGWKKGDNMATTKSGLKKKRNVWLPPKLSNGETLEFVVSPGLPICSIPLSLLCSASFRYIFFCAVYSTRVLAIWVQKPILQDLYLGRHRAVRTESSWLNKACSSFLSLPPRLDDAHTEYIANTNEDHLRFTHDQDTYSSFCYQRWAHFYVTLKH